MDKEVIMSGIQPTGDIHIGNYLGAIRNWVELAKTHECYYVIVDYHAITIDYDPASFQKSILDAAKVNIACGLEPGTCNLLIQSHVPEILELNWIFSSCTVVGRLTNMTQYKEKSQQHEANINAGLLNYPILQAADILIYKASLVPVGEDQFQHLELAREIARRFNKRFGETFPEPMPCEGEPIRILGLDGENKMSKSLNNYIGIMDPSETVWKKLAPAKTDIQRVKRSDPGRPWICNIYSYHEFFTPEQERNQCYEDCQKAAIGCVDCKKILHRNIVKRLEPIQNRFFELENDPDQVRDFLNASAENARVVAGKTLEEVRQKMGIR